MELFSRNDDQIFDIRIKGKFNIETVSQFDAEIAKASQSNITLLTLNCAELHYIDSSALGTLIRAMNELRHAGKELALYDMRPEIMKVFKLAFLDRFFLITERSDLHQKYPDCPFFV